MLQNPPFTWGRTLVGGLLQCPVIAHEGGRPTGPFAWFGGMTLGHINSLRAWGGSLEVSTMASLQRKARCHGRSRCEHEPVGWLVEQSNATSCCSQRSFNLNTVPVDEGLPSYPYSAANSKGCCATRNATSSSPRKPQRHLFLLPYSALQS